MWIHSFLRFVPKTKQMCSLHQPNMEIIIICSLPVLYDINTYAQFLLYITYSCFTDIQWDYACSQRDVQGKWNTYFLQGWATIRELNYLLYMCHNRIATYTDTDCSLYGHTIWNIYHISGDMEKANRGM